MARWQHDGGLDAALTYWTDADRMDLCTAQPTTYTEARTTYSVGNVVPTFDAIADGDTSGRKRRIQAKTGIAITANGTVTHLALTKSGDTTLRYVTITTSQGVSSGGTADTGVWDIEVADATA
jgi:hypothetical protein